MNTAINPAFPRSYPREANKKPLQQRFEEYDRRYPEVYRLFESLALESWKSGLRRFSARGLFEVMRWTLFMKDHTGRRDDGFRYNNDYTPYMVRRLIERNPHMDGFFETRKIKQP